MDKEQLRRLLHRTVTANKYDFGHVLIFGGSPGMVGAPLLVAEAALRIGAGLVTIASEAQTTERLERRTEEVMTFTMPSYANVQAASSALLDFIQDRKVNTVVIGPGLQTSALPVIRELIPELTMACVLDSGALTALHDHLDLLKVVTANNPNVILTPHMGEYAKLINTPLDDITDPHDEAPQFALQYKLTLVLKGHHTIVAGGDGAYNINHTGNPGLATAGTGDVLAGMIGGLLAQKVEPFIAAQMGVYLHGLAGDLAAEAKTELGIIASDVIEYLPAALKQAAAY